MALATLEDLEAVLGRCLESSEIKRANWLLGDASAAVVAYTGQEFAAGATIVVMPAAGTICLPQRPVTAVTAVIDTNGDAVAYTFNSYTSEVSLDTAPATSRVVITYSHGFASIPAEVVSVVAQVAARALGVAPDATAVQQQSAGPFSASLGAAASAGAFGLLLPERLILDRYTGGCGPTMPGGFAVGELKLGVWVR